MFRVRVDPVMLLQLAQEVQRVFNTFETVYEMLCVGVTLGLESRDQGNLAFQIMTERILKGHYMKQMSANT
jgi:hypothetical protein